MNEQSFIPDGYLPLTQAVLNTARARDPGAWAAECGPLEQAIYASLGRDYQPLELHAACMPDREIFPWSFKLGLEVDQQRLKAIRRAAAEGGAAAAKRFQLYRESEESLQRALYNGRVPFVLQHTRTGLLVSDTSPLIWGGANARAWFIHGGLVAVPDGGTRRIPDGLGGFYEVPSGELHKILIPERGLAAFLTGAEASDARHDGTAAADANEPHKPIARKRRRDHEKQQEDLIRAMRTIGTERYRINQGDNPPLSHSQMARAILGRCPELGKQYNPDTLRKIIAGQYEPAKRVVEEGLAKPVWEAD